MDNVHHFHELTAQVISLPHRTDRREQFTAHAKDQGIPFRFVDGHTGGPVYQNIARSHKDVIRWAKSRHDPYVLVMEDDCWFPSSDGFQWFLDQVPRKPFDIFLGGIYGGAPDGDGLLKSFVAAHCYIVADRFYDRFLSVPENKHLDHALAGLGVYYVCQPYAAIQRNGFSDNVRKVVDYSHYVDGHYRK